ncbi:hypothetical protein [Rhodalgimonas zhirmunskyi]|uniref:Uncharacterized protein n=1 Tax=Rhodalgimonas zhirmunskyi TaxID=2964767 RepID=A0AAJ1U8H2_9RHOB|nr:hypothetical protein [Rhodoalgimonas zhirmunskyi]MDQ2094715.1 hypothetical protein [Rhodoalgimonas zhirmunskyi]
MAIPIRVTVTCPECGASEQVTIADSSIGPRGRVSATPIYAMPSRPAWPKSREEREGETITWLGCAACGAEKIMTVDELARGTRGARDR